MLPDKVVIISGGFDPIHRGHIKYIRGAAQLAGPNGVLIVGLNSDSWLRRKKGQEFMYWKDRKAVVENIKGVDGCLTFDDSDGTARDLIRKIAKVERYLDSEIIFANGGDRSSAEATPETDVCEELGIKIVYGVGGEDKANSSSWILDKWDEGKDGRP